MLGTGLQFNRSRNGEDRFYSAARARRSRNLAQSQDHLRRAQSDFTVSQSPQQGHAGAAEAGPGKPVAVQLCSKEMQPSVQETCNLGRFLESVKPSVPAYYLSKTTMKGWRTSDVEFQPYFVLGDLWDSFKEWSAYGAGVPLVLDDHDDIVQYYVPYLSGIQLYGDPSGSLVKSRQPSEDSDGEYFKDSCSEGSSDCDERGYLNYSQR